MRKPVWALVTVTAPPVTSMVPDDLAGVDDLALGRDDARAGRHGTRRRPARR